FLTTTLALAALLIIRNQPESRADRTGLRFSIYPPQDTSFGSVTLSPDGRHLAFTAVPTSNPGGKTMLWVRPLDSVNARSLPDTEEASFPFWSPSSNELGFFAAGKLWTIDLAGGSPRIIADAPNGRG